jgi:hypothetical protein
MGLDNRAADEQRQPVPSGFEVKKEWSLACAELRWFEVGKEGRKAPSSDGFSEVIVTYAVTGGLGCWTRNRNASWQRIYSMRRGG